MSADRYFVFLDEPTAKVFISAVSFVDSEGAYVRGLFSIPREINRKVVATLFCVHIVTDEPALKSDHRPDGWRKRVRVPYGPITKVRGE